MILRCTATLKTRFCVLSMERRSARIAATSTGIRRRKQASPDERPPPAQQSAAEQQPSPDLSLSKRRKRQPESQHLNTAPVVSTPGQLLFDLGPLVAGQVVRRPSASIKTPYVADVILLPEASAASCSNDSPQANDNDNDQQQQQTATKTILAHTPALDCAGMISPGCRVHLTEHPARTPGQQTTKTTHAVQVVEDVTEGCVPAFVGAHPFLAERIASTAVERHLLPLPPQLQGYNNVLKQQTEGSGRFDFALCFEDGSRLLMEVKNVVCADKPGSDQGLSPAKQSKAAVCTSSAWPHRTALFPHGTRKPGSGVVSDRAIKHLHELTQLQQAGIDSQGRAVKCAVLFIVNRCDCGAFRPCHEADMLFAQMLHRAQQTGVLVLAHDVCWQGGQVMWGKPLPVVFGDGVNGKDIDNEHLAKVLAFNATNPRTRWKKQKGVN